MALKTVIVGVTGGIAAYKSCILVSKLRKMGYEVKVIMSENATQFVTPLTLETLSNNRVVRDMFDKERPYEVEHISYAKQASAFVIAPATANFIGKAAQGIADDMLTTTIMATLSPVIVCPAMNVNMVNNPVVQANIAALKERGWLFVEPSEGMLACGDVGKGRMEEPETIAEFVDNLLTPNPDYRGKTVLVTAGATREPIDGVRFISNRSSGKMGMAIAEAVIDRGGRAIVVQAFTSVDAPKGVEVIRVSTTEEMRNAVMDHLSRADIIIKAAAPSDYKVKNYSASKIKAESLSLELTKNPDIAAEVGQRKGDRKMVVFAAETENLLMNARQKLLAKNADMIVANDVTAEGAGFDADTNIATLIKADGAIVSLEKMTKTELAHIILDEIVTL
ncbi:MAG: bifunctional phosphopantothenoylcysteine decarboxylase/phosphopantothenate--cysteine ligase CoaBC [Clostridia bacterium]|nr:bifunctional phosphopantothenoylcysteine decarboxylase/phosphopantothenate--cysteine ligase CoaBC [Clostridia bacterium]